MSSYFDLRGQAKEDKAPAFDSIGGQAKQDKASAAEDKVGAGEE